MTGPLADELAALEAISRVLGRPPAGETWLGDDAAVVLVSAGALLFATDVTVEEVHFSRSLSTLDDVGWKSLAVNVSDIAAMGGRPLAAIVGVSGATREDLDLLYVGLAEAATKYSCPIVGGDLSAGRELVISVAIIGVPEEHAVLRSGARAGDHIFLTGPLGAAAAGLRALREDGGASGPSVDAFRRPVARALEGRVAARAGADAMIDVSDGLGIDLDRLATASGVGIRLDDVPVADGASLEDALGGGEDYELVFTAPGWSSVEEAFASAGLERPVRIGEVVSDPTKRTLRGDPLRATGYTHTLR